MAPNAAPAPQHSNPQRTRALALTLGVPGGSLLQVFASDPTWVGNLLPHSFYWHLDRAVCACQRALKTAAAQGAPLVTARAMRAALEEGADWNDFVKTLDKSTFGGLRVWTKPMLEQLLDGAGVRRAPPHRRRDLLWLFARQLVKERIGQLKAKRLKKQQQNDGDEDDKDKKKRRRDGDRLDANNSALGALPAPPAAAGGSQGGVPKRARASPPSIIIPAAAASPTISNNAAGGASPSSVAPAAPARDYNDAPQQAAAPASPSSASSALPDWCIDEPLLDLPGCDAAAATLDDDGTTSDATMLRQANASGTVPPAPAPAAPVTRQQAAREAQHDEALRQQRHAAAHAYPASVLDSLGLSATAATALGHALLLLGRVKAAEARQDALTQPDIDELLTGFKGADRLQVKKVVKQLHPDASPRDAWAGSVDAKGVMEAAYQAALQLHQRSSALGGERIEQQQQQQQQRRREEEQERSNRGGGGGGSSGGRRDNREDQARSSGGGSSGYYGDKERRRGGSRQVQERERRHGRAL